MVSHLEALKQLAESGNPEAQFELAMYFHSQKEFDTAIAWLKAASSNSYMKAMTNLAICYYFGDGVTQSYEEALALLQKSSENGDLSAKYYIGLSYLNGNGVKQDCRKGFEILLDCAKNGMPWAQLAIGDCYRDGIGTEADLFEAVSWYARAAEQDVDEAGRKFNSIYYSTHFVDQNGNQRIFWFETSAIKQRS